MTPGDEYCLKGNKYEVVISNALIADIIKLMVGQSILKKVHDAWDTTDKTKPTQVVQKHKYVRNRTSGIGFCEVCNSDDEYDGNHIFDLKVEVKDTVQDKAVFEGSIERFLNNHEAIENNIETMCKENIGHCEDKKTWIKDLKAAVKEYGHDEILTAFYQWSLTQGNFLGRKPILAFLKNVGSHVSSVSKKPSATNPILDRVEQKIAYITDNAVFFTGEYRFKLAGLLKDYGEELVLIAFADFYQNVEPRGVPWAARDFLQRASVMINTILQKREDAKRTADLLALAVSGAKQDVDEETEEEAL